MNVKEGSVLLEYITHKKQFSYIDVDVALDEKTFDVKLHATDDILVKNIAFIGGNIGEYYEMIPESDKKFLIK